MTAPGGYQVRKYNEGPSANFTLRSSIGSDDISGTTTDFSDGRWHYVAAVYDPVNFQRRLYVDGVAQINITDGNLGHHIAPERALDLRRRGDGPQQHRPGNHLRLQYLPR